MSQYSHLSDPDPEWLEVAPKPTSEPGNPLALDVRRHQLTQFVQVQHELWEYPKSGLNVSNITIPVQGASIPARTYVPEAKDDETRFPLLVWFHGGGFQVGDLELDDALLRLICVKQRISCVNVDYRLAPEHPFPIPLQDCFNATKWAADNALSLFADLSKGFMVGGASAGGNLAAVVALKARDDPSLKLTGQVLQIPSVCHPAVYPETWKGEILSLEQNRDAPLLTREEVFGAYAVYGAPDPTSPEVSPLLATSHWNLPSAYFQVSGMDPLRDEAFVYEKVLQDSNVPTRLDVYPGQPHGFYDVGPQMTASRRWREDVLKGIQWLLESKGE